MKKVLSILFMLPLTILTYGQADKGIKIYTNYFSDSYSIASTVGTETTIEDKSFNSFGSVSAGYIWKKNERQWSELELGFAFEASEYLRQVSITGQMNTQIRQRERTSTALFSSRYEWQYQLLGNESISFNLGSSTQLRWLNHQFEPATSPLFPHYVNEVSFSLAAVPRVIFYFERFAIDINLPITLIQSGFSLTRVENPVLTPEERSSSGFDFELFPNEHWIQGRVGIWWYL